MWTSRRGQRFDRETYIRCNLLAHVRWHSQRLIDPAVTIAGRRALMICTVSDVVDVGSGSTVYEMPMTQVWIDDGDGWRCLAGHTGPLIGHGS